MVAVAVIHELPTLIAATRPVMSVFK